jgi:HEAT repeat protein
VKHLNRSLRNVAQSLALVALVPMSLAAELELPKDGWVSWQVEAVEDAPDVCCFDGWRERKLSRNACKLDEGRDGFNISTHDGTMDSVKVYARLNGGKIERLQALSSTCPVQTRTPIQDLGDVSTDDSARWLVTQLKDFADGGKRHPSLTDMAMAALGTHRGDFSRDALAGFARHDTRTEVRKKALFWMATMRGPAGADVVSSAMFNDKDEEVRKHATFALTQSKSTRIAADIIRLANTDKSGEVRAQAWFWLAQTGAPEAEQAIGTAMRKETDDHVREQAVFALSQLPEERATRALIAVAEDQSLTREQRKRAIFWLSQSGSNSAQAYLDRVLTRVTGD